MTTSLAIRHIIWVGSVYLVTCATPALGQTEIKNPLTGDPSAIKEGSSLFRANCSPCHGLNAGGGGRGPDLRAGLWVHGASDAAIFRTISQGVPGTEMPANPSEDSEIGPLVPYLLPIGAMTKPPVAADVAQGERFFFGKGACAQCHMVKGHGGR